MKYGLSDITVSRILKVLSSFSAIDRAILYGSRARRNYRVGSDIDLTLDGEDLTFKDLCLVDERLDDLMLPYHFDLSVLKHITNEALLDNIRSEGKIFYQR